MTIIENVAHSPTSNICHEQPDIDLADDSSKIIINTRGKTIGFSKDLINFVEYINTGKTNDNFTAELEREVQLQRLDTKKAVGYMTIQVALQDEYIKGEIKGRNEGRIEGKIEGKMEGKMEIVT